MKEHRVPGLSVAVAKHGKVLSSRGYGYADIATREPVTPSSLFRIARELGTNAPADQAAVIKSMLSQKLDFAPGERYAYSNFGYCLLGRVIEKMGGQTYESYVRDHVLTPIGITSMRMDCMGDGKVNHWHTGSLDGTATRMIRRHDGLSIAALLNSRVTASEVALGPAIDRLLHEIATGAEPADER